MPGVEQEKGGIIKRGGRFLNAVVEADVPKVTITIRKSYGGAYAVMGSKQLSADLNFAWPTARIAVIGAEGAAQLLVKRFPDPTAPEVQKIRADFIEGYNLNMATPWIAAERGFIDAVIEPHETRLLLRKSHAAAARQADPAGAAQARPDPDLSACRWGELAVEFTSMSNHFTGLSLGPPLGDQRLDLCDLYAFESPADPDRTVLILNANPQADFLHPDAIYRLAIDNDGDLRNDIAFSFVFSEPAGRPPDRRRLPGHRRRGRGARSRRVEDLRGVSRCPSARPRTSPRRASSRSSPVPAATRSSSTSTASRTCSTRRAAATSPRRTSAPRITLDGVDSNTEANVFSMVHRMPTSALGADPDIRIWGRCSLRRDGELLHVDRAGHPSVSSFFNTDDTKEEYNAGEPVRDRERWIGMFIHLMGHTGGYTREEAIAAIDQEGTLPDMLTFNPAKPAKYPNGRVFTDDVIDYRLAFLTRANARRGAEPAHRHPRTSFRTWVRRTDVRSRQLQPVVDLERVAPRHDRRAAVARIVRRDHRRARRGRLGEDPLAGHRRRVGVDVERARIVGSRELDRAVREVADEHRGLARRPATPPTTPAYGPAPAAATATR